MLFSYFKLFPALIIIFTTVNCENLQVEIENGILRGFREKSLKGRDIHSFLGIPFAQPPVGELRLQDPVEASPWDGILEANKDPEICLQYNADGLMTNQLIMEGSEDCLFLNVFTPKVENTTSQLLPVLLYVHGGYFICGSAKDYKPYALLDEDIVLVVIQYRLGPFGFLSTEDSTMPGNYGLKDQAMALKWVQKNIIAFGGDPKRVTIFGESAGGSSVHFLMLSPQTKGLFHGAISQSGNANCPWTITRDAKETSQKVGRAIECPVDESQQFLECLQQKSGEEMLTAISKTIIWGFYPVLTLPRVDGEFIPSEPIAMLSNQEYNKVNFISGITRNEGIMSLITLKSTFNESTEKSLPKEFDQIIAPLSLVLFEEEDSDELSKRAFEHYLEGRKLDYESLFTLEQMFTDRFFSVCHDQATRFLSNDSEISVYRYQLDFKGQFSYAGLFNLTLDGDMVAHGDDLFFLFTGGDTYKRPLTRPEDLKMREIFIKLWTNFAATGNPTPNDSMGFEWNSTTPSEFVTLKLVPEPYMTNFVKTKANDFWRSLPLTENDILEEME